ALVDLGQSCLEADKPEKLAAVDDAKIAGSSQLLQVRERVVVLHTHASRAPTSSRICRSRKTETPRRPNLRLLLRFRWLCPNRYGAGAWWQNAESGEVWRRPFKGVP